MKWIRRLLGILTAQSKQQAQNNKDERECDNEEYQEFQENQNQNKEYNKPRNEKSSMVKKTVISKVVDVVPEDDVLVLPANRTLYADQFTDEAPLTDEERAPWSDARNMEDVFEHYQPKKEGVALVTEDGGTTYESFDFRQIKDFEDEQLIDQSEYLSNLKAKIESYNSVLVQLERNKGMRTTLKDDAARNNLKNALKAMLAELEAAE